MRHKNDQSGYIALVSVIIISVLLELAVIGLSFGLYTHTQTLSQTEQKQQSFYGALSCIHSALLEYADTESVSIRETDLTDTSCTILSFFGSTIISESKVADASTKLRAEFDPITKIITSVTDI